MWVYVGAVYVGAVYVGAPCECMCVPRVCVCGCPVWEYVGAPCECMWVPRVFEWVYLCCLCLSVPMALCLRVFMLCVCVSVGVSNWSSCVSAQCTLGWYKIHLWYTNMLETRQSKVVSTNVCEVHRVKVHDDLEVYPNPTARVSISWSVPFKRRGKSKRKISKSWIKDKTRTLRSKNVFEYPKTLRQRQLDRWSP